MIVGSAIVRYLEQVAEGRSTLETALEELREYVTQMIAAAHGGGNQAMSHE